MIQLCDFCGCKDSGNFDIKKERFFAYIGVFFAYYVKKRVKTVIFKAENCQNFFFSLSLQRYTYIVPCMNPNKITIQQLSDLGHTRVLDYKGQLMISDHIAREYLFEEPCRIDAVLILFCLRGRLEYIVNLEHNVVTEPSILVNMPENIIQLKGSENLEAYSVLISTDLLNSLPYDIRQNDNAFRSIKHHFSAAVPLDQLVPLIPFYELIKHYLQKTGPETEDIVRSLLMAFLLSIMGLMREHQVKEIDADRAESRSRRQLFERFMETLNHYHQQERQVQFYADKLCITPKYLSMVVKGYSGKSPSDWICEYVIAEAKSLLHYSRLSAQEVSFHLNFPSQSAFGKFFKQKTGMSPTQYIKEMKQE